MDVEILKKPQVWSIVVPALLGIWTLFATVNCLQQRTAARNKMQEAQTVKSDADYIIASRKSLQADLPGGTLRNFEGKTSAGACAKAAGIPLNRLVRGQSPAPKTLKNGSTENTETYYLRSVRLVQAAEFVDYAERNFASLTCNHLSFIPLSGSKNDAWEVTVRLKYIVK